MLKTDQSPETILLEAGAWRRVLKWEGEPVLTISLRWPRLPEDLPGPRRVSRYYRQVADCWRTRWETELLRRAREAAAAAREESRPFSPWSAVLDFTPTLREGGLLSLYQDAVECTGDTRPVTLRRSDTWELPSGTLRSLASFLRPPHRRRRVLAEVAAQIERRIASGESLFYEDWRRRLPAAFDPDRFYLTGEGAVLYFPLCTVAPYAEGIPVFPIQIPPPAP